MTAVATPELAAWDRIRVRYPYEARDAVGPVSLTLNEGERLLVLGPSGCGKSTLLATLTGLVPHAIPADVEGSARIAGCTADERTPAAWADTVGILFQDAERTLAGFTVEDEIAFALENRALPPSQIDGRVAEGLAKLGLPGGWRRRRIATLSGGEKQLVALATLMAARPRIALVDEPSANLAPAAAALVADLLFDAAGPEGTVLVDHLPGPLLDRIDRVAVLDGDGFLLVEGPTADIFARHGEDLETRGIWTPTADRLRRRIATSCDLDLPPVLTVGELCARLDAIAPGDRERCRTALAAAPELAGPPMIAADRLVQLEAVSCAPPFGPVVLRQMNLSIHAGEVLAIVGRNGAGKSTLAPVLAGLAPPREGRRAGPVGAVAFQNPEAHFVEASARDELLSAGLAENDVAPALEAWGLTAVAGQHPFTLSEGEKRRLALATLTSTERWPLLVLDEPTAGLDARGAAFIAERIRQLGETGRAIVLMTHDIDLVLRLCHRVVVLADGGIAAEGPPCALLRDESLLERAGLGRPELMPLIDWLEGERTS